MLILFFDSKGVIHHEYVPEGQIANATFYIPSFAPFVLTYCPCEARNVERLEVFLLYDNAHLQTAVIVQQFLAKEKNDTVESPSIFASWVTLHVCQI